MNRGLIARLNSRSWWLMRRPVAVGLFVAVGPWASLGLHVGLRPLCVDIHLPWLTVGVMSADAGEEIRLAEAYDRGEKVFISQMAEVME